MTPREKSLLAADRYKDRLKAARKRAGLTQDELVARADISTVTLSKLETGVNKPAFEIFVSLAYALNLSPNFFVGWDESDNRVGDANRQQVMMRLSAAVESLPDEWIEQLISMAELAKKAD